jgi:trans-aconitate methyltransferase
MATDPKEHWQTVYGTKAPTDVSWYQPIPQRSLALIQSTGLPPDAAILDVGGGASTLVDYLLAAGFSDITVLDVAPAALEATKARLGVAGAPVQMIAADVTTWQPSRRYDVWHDRAVFHFLVDEAQRERYLNVLRVALAPGGYLVMATFGPEGPTRCSGLDVRRYAAAELSAVLGTAFRLATSVTEEHTTPSGNVQQFMYGLWQAE